MFRYSHFILVRALPLGDIIEDAPFTIVTREGKKKAPRTFRQQRLRKDLLDWHIVLFAPPCCDLMYRRRERARPDRSERPSLKKGNAQQDRPPGIENRDI